MFWDTFFVKFQVVDELVVEYVEVSNVFGVNEQVFMCFFIWIKKKICFFIFLGNEEKLIVQLFFFFSQDMMRKIYEEEYMMF